MRPCRRQDHTHPIPSSYSQAVQIFPTEQKSAESSQTESSPCPTALCSPAPNICPWQSPDKWSCVWNSAEEHPLSTQVSPPTALSNVVPDHRPPFPETITASFNLFCIVSFQSLAGKGIHPLQKAPWLLSQEA